MQSAYSSIINKIDFLSFQTEEAARSQYLKEILAAIDTLGSRESTIPGSGDSDK
jgi:hypothetical protein